MSYFLEKMTTPNLENIFSLEDATLWLAEKQPAEIFETITKLAGNKKKTQMRENALILFGSYFDKITPLLEPYFLENYHLVFTLAGDFQSSVFDRAKDLSRRIFDYFTKYSSKGYMTMEALLSAINTGSKIGTKKLGFQYMNELILNSQKEVRANLEHIVPRVAESLIDMNLEISTMAEETLKLFCEAIENADIDPFIPQLINVFRDPENATEVIHGLAAVTFVQEVEAPTLSIIVPVLMLGFRAKEDSTKRLAAVIVANMIKLVNNPLEVSNYLPKLLPPMENAAKNVSEPEARSMCGRALGQLREIETKITTLPKPPVVELSNTYAKNLIELLVQARDLERDIWENVLSGLLTKEEIDREYTKFSSLKTLDEVEEEDDAELLCDCDFTLAYGSKILLHNTKLKLKRGYRYGLLGGNNSGKSTLLRAIANEQLEGFPPASQLRTVFVEADILGELSHLSCIEYVFADKRIQKYGVSKEEISQAMLNVGFTERMLDNPVTTLSGGWRIKLALTRAMLQKADILMLDDPTNHLDVLNVAWLENYLCSLKDVTSIIISHNRGLLDKCCTHMLHIENYKLHLHKGNLSEFTKINPKAASYFEMKSSSGFKFKFPAPGFVDGVKQAGTVLMKMDNISFKYPTGEANVLNNVSIRVSMASKVGCVGRNGQGKSTLIKLLTGELQSTQGTVWRKTGLRFGYVSQHSFHHIEQHLNKTPYDYLCWRYSHGVDREILEKDTYIMTQEEEEFARKPKEIEYNDERGLPKKVKWTVEKLTGERKTIGKDSFIYEVKWEHGTSNFYSAEKLVEWGFEKRMKVIDLYVEAATGLFKRSMGQKAVEEHFLDFGLEPEFSSHTRMCMLSDSQKLKVVLAAAIWQSPSIIILDEPTNFFDRESMIALAEGLRNFTGGFIVISHNDDFIQNICKEFWTLENGTLNVHGDQEWMTNQLKNQVEFKMVEEIVDRHGNVEKVKISQRNLSNKDRKALLKKFESKIKNGIPLDADEEELYYELKGE